jgi:hypothetical protein
MDKYNKTINLYINLPSSIGLIPVPLSSYDIDEWIGKCENIEVLKYLKRSISKHIGVLNQGEYDYDVMR